MKSLAIIGSGGMLGSDLVRYLGPCYNITPIHRKNYKSNIGKRFDIVINANGNSRRFWANLYPREDFVASTLSVLYSISDFPCTMYIYISSPDVYETHWGSKEDDAIDSTKLQPYGFHKYLSELIVKQNKEYHIILRCSMILGSNLKKGPLFDIINDLPLSVTLGSQIQLITTREVSEIIQKLLKRNGSNDTINIGGVGAFPFTKLKKYFEKKTRVKLDAERQRYRMNVEKLRGIYPNLSTSEDYLQEFLQ